MKWMPGTRDLALVREAAAELALGAGRGWLPGLGVDEQLRQRARAQPVGVGLRRSRRRRRARRRAGSGAARSASDAAIPRGSRNGARYSSMLALGRACASSRPAGSPRRTGCCVEDHRLAGRRRAALEDRARLLRPVVPRRAAGRSPPCRRCRAPRSRCRRAQSKPSAEPQSCTHQRDPSRDAERLEQPVEIARGARRSGTSPGPTGELVGVRPCRSGRARCSARGRRRAE